MKTYVFYDVAPCSLLDVSEELTASVTITLMMETSINMSTRLHGSTSEKTTIFILVAMITLNFTFQKLYNSGSSSNIAYFLLHYSCTETIE